MNATRALLLLFVVAVMALAGAVVVVFSPHNAAPTQPPVAAASPSPGPSSVVASVSSATPGPLVSAPSSTSPGVSPTPLSPLAKVIQPESLPPEQLTGYIWPVRDALITSRFAPRAATDGGFVLIDGVSYHDGVDLATHCGDKVRAAHDGTVLYAGRNFDPFFGYWGDATQPYARLERLGRTNEQPIVVVIDDGDGYRSVYVHLGEADAEKGQVVHAGDIIGLEGMTGFATGCHVHYGMIRMDGSWQAVVPRLAQFGYPPYVRERVDPLKVLPWGDPDAPLRLREKVGAVPTPTPTPEPSPSPSTPPESSARPSPTPSVNPSPHQT